MSWMLERLKLILKEKLPLSPSAELIGYRLLAVDYGKVEIELEVGEKHNGSLGQLHGGILCVLADTAMGNAFTTTLNDDETCSTADFRINFLRTVEGRKVRAIGKVVKRGRVLGYAESELFDDSNRLIAKSSCTIMVLARSDVGNQ